MTLPGSADGFLNAAYSVGGFTDRVLNKLSPNLWGGPNYGSVDGSNINWALWPDTDYWKGEGLEPFGDRLGVFLGPAADISYWEEQFPVVDPKVMKIQNTLFINLGIRTEEGDVTARSLSVWWREGTTPSQVGAWGRLDEDVLIHQYDTPVIGINDVSIGLTSWVAP